MRARILTLALAALVAAGGSSAGEPPSEPVLRIETGMHTAIITRIGVDVAERFLVTASNDKTARVWDLETGRLLRVLRPPIGAGNEGKLYAAAISPDGSIVAAGGWTGWDWDGTASIYLFERQSGRLLRRLSGLPNAIVHLAFSRDGEYLAATLGSNGVRVWRTASWRLAASDTDYGDRSNWADFDGAGRLVTTSYDGFVRLYDRDFDLIAKERAPGGKRPFAAAFSPDASRIAVGFDDTTAVNVLSGRDVSFLFAPDTAGVGNGNLGAVAWSADGAVLFAGGLYDVAGTNPIRRWADAGRGSAKDLSGPLNTIMDIRPLLGGSIVYGAADPAFGVLDTTGNKSLDLGPEIADFRGQRESPRISANGTIVSFGIEYGGDRPSRFSLADRGLALDPADDPALRPPRTDAPGLEVADWRDTYEPRLNGEPLALKQYETSFSLAIALDGERFMLGTNWLLRQFDRSGNEVWQIPVPGIVWGVNVSGDGRVAVAAYGDGTIRWHRMTDGVEVLAFFPHRDGERWVAWTPEGYYMASAGGEDLIGWHVNNGKDQAADFFSASRFRDTFYRPDIVERVLETLDPAEAKRLADAAAGRKVREDDIASRLPPVVSIVSHSDFDTFNEQHLTLRYRVRTPSEAPVTRIRAFIDGRPVATDRGIEVAAKDGVEREIELTLPRRDVEVAVIAENRFAASEAARVFLEWGGQAEFAAKPKLYVLAVGVGDYSVDGLDLEFAAKDARDFAAVMQAQAGGLYREVEVKLLVDGEATRDEVVDGLDWLERETTARDVAMLFLAGHGVDDRNGYYYFLPHNADPERLKRTGVNYADLQNTLYALSGKVVLFIDTCKSGGVTQRLGARRGDVPVDVDRVANDLASAENGVVVFASSTGRQFALERADWGNGAFTKALVEGLQGEADYTDDGAISVNELELFIAERVKALTEGEQTPTMSKPQTIPDFPLAVAG